MGEVDMTENKITIKRYQIHCTQENLQKLMSEISRTGLYDVLANPDHSGTHVLTTDAPEEIITNHARISKRYW
jgi:hypothetical protein